jgi:hypothetical protein
MNPESRFNSKAHKQLPRKNEKYQRMNLYKILPSTMIETVVEFGTWKMCIVYSTKRLIVWSA